MIGRRTVVGLSLLCALLFSAIAVQSAAAAAATNTTAFTCVKKTKGDFKDEHCDEAVTPGTGEFGHELIPAGKTNVEAPDLNNPVLKGEAAGAKLEIECEKAVTTGTIENEEVGGVGSKKHNVTGSISTKFEGNCNVKLLKNCDVEEPIVVSAKTEGVEGLGAKANEMGVEFKEASGSETFTTIAFINEGANKCVLNGQKIPVKSKTAGTVASAIATGKPSNTAKHSGATSIFTDAMTTETLSFNAKPAGFELESTVKMTEGGNPIALTTVT